MIHQSGRAHPGTVLRLIREQNESIGVRVRQRAQQHAVHHREHRRGRADPERERESRYQREPGRPAQRPRPIPRVLHQALEPAAAPHLAGHLPNESHVSKLATYRPLSVVVSLAARDPLFDCHAKVRAELLVELAVSPATAPFESS